MNGFYLWAMRCASVILFVIGLLAIAATIGFQLWNYMQMSGGMDGSFGPGSGQFRWLQMFAAILAGLSASILPLFGAALLWRIDRWHAAASSASAKERAE